MVRDCPVCGLVNPPSAARCDCGYDFSTRRMKESYLKPGEWARQEGDPWIGFPRRILLVLVLVSPAFIWVWITSKTSNALGGFVFLISCLLGIVAAVSLGDPSIGAFVFGATALALDFYLRRKRYPCPMFDTVCGSKFLMLPGWSWGVLGLILDGWILLAIHAK